METQMENEERIDQNLNGKIQSMRPSKTTIWVNILPWIKKKRSKKILKTVFSDQGKPLFSGNF